MSLWLKRRRRRSSPAGTSRNWEKQPWPPPARLLLQYITAPIRTLCFTNPEAARSRAGPGRRFSWRSPIGRTPAPEYCDPPAGLLEEEQQSNVGEMLQEQAGGFARDEKEVGWIDNLEFEINDDQPVRRNYVSLPTSLYEEVKRVVHTNFLLPCDALGPGSSVNSVSPARKATACDASP